MKPSELYLEMRSLAEKLGIRVVEKILKIPTIPVQSGDCVVYGNLYIYIDRRLGLWEKIQILAIFLHTQPLDDIFVKPAVRDIIERYAQKSKKILKKKETNEHQIGEQYPY